MSDSQKFIQLTPQQIDMAMHLIKRRPINATFWGQGESQRMQCKIIDYQKVQDTFFISLAPEKQTFTDLQELAEKQCETILFNVQLPGDNLFFKAQHRRSKKGEIHLRLLDEVFKVQRRQHPRLPTENMNIVVQITLAAESPFLPIPTQIKGEMLDLSSGGLAVKGVSEEFSDIEIGQSISELKFTVRKRTITCQAQLRFKMPLKYQDRENRSFIKLGFLFENLNAVDREFLEGFVFENSSKFFGRL